VSHHESYGRDSPPAAKPGAPKLAPQRPLRNVKPAKYPENSIQRIGKGTKDDPFTGYCLLSGRLGIPPESAAVSLSKYGQTPSI